MGILPENRTGSVLAVNGSARPSPSPSRTIALGLTLGSFILFALLGNVLVVLSVVCHRPLQTVTNYFTVNLAVADLLLSCSVLPLSAWLEVQGHWPLGRLLCDIWAALDVLCSTASILSLCVISIERYIGVSYPLRHPAIVTQRKALLTLLGVWTLALAISVGPLLGWKEPAPPDHTVCRVTEEPGYVLFSALGSFYAPLAVILVMYCRVYIVARRETRSLEEGRKRERSKGTGDPVTLRIHRPEKRADPLDQTQSHPQGRGTQLKTQFSVLLLKFRRQKKAAKTLGIVVGGFILCWLPFFVVLPLGSFFPKYKAPETIFKITFWLGYFNSCINPIIYPAANKEFRKAFQNILKGQCCHRKKASFHPSLSNSHSTEGQKNVVRIPVGSRETFFKISKSDRDCEWKLFCTLPDHGTENNSRHLNGRGRTILHCCCTDANVPNDETGYSAPGLKTHAYSVGDYGDPV
ncbi:alpha-1A adrenergic receptor-like [Rhincodon typus]|uniref:alpha-1A adrenergic receptor-like n=1 Tax=Rhincodon typus TaxID=259920 RepID=UPI0009A3E8CD|nr:alpha-1A adrenergic receptor-like [Rhincodon typus]